MAPGGHGHAILSVPGGPRGDPFVPQVGDVYLVNTILYSASASLILPLPASAIPLSSHPANASRRETKRAPLAGPVTVSRSGGCDKNTR